MGFLRGGLLVVVSVILFISLLIGNTFLVFSSSLNYENLQTHLGPVIQDIAESQIEVENIEEGMDQLKEYCKANQDFVLEQSEYDFSISCSEVLSSDTEKIINNEVNDLLEEIYYKDYDCGFIDCFEEDSIPFFLISEKSQKYFYNKYYYLLLVSIILILSMFFIVENKMNFPIVVGSILVVSSLPFAKLGWLSSISSNKYFIEMMTLFFTSSRKVFLTMLIIGLIAIGIGVGLRFWGLGTKIAEWKKKRK